MNEGLIFADGRMLTAVEAAAYIKELKEEIEKLKEEVIWLKETNGALNRQLWPRRADSRALTFAKAFSERFEIGLILNENEKLKEENEKMKTEMKSLLETLKIILDTHLGFHIERDDDDSYNKIKNIPE